MNACIYIIAFIYFSPDFLEFTSVTDSGWCQCPCPASPCARGTLGIAKWEPNVTKFLVTQIFLGSHSFHSTESLQQSNLLRSVLLPHHPEGRLCPFLLLSQQCESSRRDSQVHSGVTSYWGTDLPGLPLQCCTPALGFSGIWQPGCLKNLKENVSWIYSWIGKGGKKSTIEVPREDGNSKWKTKRKDEAGPLVWFCPVSSPGPPWGAAWCAMNVQPAHQDIHGSAHSQAVTSNGMAPSQAVRAQQAGQPQLPAPLLSFHLWPLYKDANAATSLCGGINVPSHLWVWQLRADVIATNHLDLSWLMDV